MKKIIFSITIIVLFIAVFGACKKELHTNNTNQKNTNTTVGTFSNRPPGTDNAYRRKFVIRHSGSSCVCPDCKCPGCPCPLGVCTCEFASIPPSYILSDQDKLDDMGTVYIQKEGEKLAMIFEQPTALSDGTVPVSGDYLLTSQESEDLGFSSTIKILEGVYDADFSDYEYGKILVNIE